MSILKVSETSHNIYSITNYLENVAISHSLRACYKEKVTQG